MTDKAAALKEHFAKMSPGKLMGLRQITDVSSRFKFLQTTAVERMKTLNKIVDQHAHSWLDRYGIKTSELAGAVDPTWYMSGPLALSTGSGSGRAAQGDY
ncbi:MAG: hypothetical protein NTX64_03930 [Elusimicrobia bacterium]|nr:hypothetical protein [Elusimicrobiota bacterium]